MIHRYQCRAGKQMGTDTCATDPEQAPGFQAAEKASVTFPLETSVGYQLRTTNRLMQRLLQTKIEPYGITLGMWYFLRALWEEDGLTQRELSQRIGTMEPTTLTAIAGMERGGLVTRKRNEQDRRKINVFLTQRGRDLATESIPLAIKVVETSVKGFSQREVDLLLALLIEMQNNITAALSSEGVDGEVESEETL